MEEKEHVIQTLQTKVALLRKGQSVPEGEGGDEAATPSADLIDLGGEAASEGANGGSPVGGADSQKVAVLEGKVSPAG